LSSYTTPDNSDHIISQENGPLELSSNGEMYPKSHNEVPRNWTLNGHIEEGGKPTPRCYSGPPMLQRFLAEGMEDQPYHAIGAVGHLSEAVRAEATKRAPDTSAVSAAGATAHSFLHEDEH
jgi:hypothetical protein